MFLYMIKPGKKSFLCRLENLWIMHKSWTQHRKLKLNLIMGREHRFKNLLTCLNEQTNLCKLET